jgi:hypothetical protein
MSLEADSGHATRSELVYQANSCSETITLAQSLWNLIAPLFFRDYRQAFTRAAMTDWINPRAARQAPAFSETQRLSGKGQGLRLRFAQSR